MALDWEKFKIPQLPEIPLQKFFANNPWDKYQSAVNAIAVADKFKSPLDALTSNAFQIKNWALDIPSMNIALAIRNALPQTTLNALDAISAHHRQFKSITDSFIKFENYFPATVKINSLLDTLKAATADTANWFLIRQRWDDIDALAASYDEAIALTERIGEQEILTKEDLENLNISLQNFIVEQSKKSNYQKFLEIISIISFIIGLIALKELIPKPEAATKADIEALHQSIFSTIQDTITATKEKKAIIKNCTVHLKPNSKSYAVSTIRQYTSVIVLDTLNQWLNVSFIDPKDGLTQTGWVMKKHVQSHKQKPYRKSPILSKCLRKSVTSPKQKTISISM